MAVGVAAKIQVEISLLDKMSSGLNSVKKKFDDLGESARRTGKALTLGLTVPIVTGAAFVVNAASDQMEALDASSKIFGKNGKAMEKWAETGATAFGLNKTEALTASSLFGIFGKDVAGIADKDLPKFSQALVKVAGDLGSFHNVDPTDMLLAVQAGLRGETEPLARYGIMLNEAAVGQRALAMTGKTSTEQLTAGEKVLARQELILEGAAYAANNFIDTSEGLANQQRILRKQVDNLAASLGKKLLPPVTKAVQWLNKMVMSFEELSPKAQKFIMIALGIAAAIGPVLWVLGVLSTTLAVLLSPIGLLIAAVFILSRLFDIDLVSALKGIVGTLFEFGQALVSAFQSGTKVNDLVAKFPGPLQSVAKFFLLAADAAGYLLRVFKADGLSGVLKVLPDVLGQVADGFMQMAGAGLSAAADLFRSIDWGAIGLAVLDAAMIAFSAIPWDTIWAGTKSVLSGLRDAFNNFDYNNLGVIVGEGIRAAIIAVGPTILRVGGELITSLKEGLQGKSWQEILVWLALLPVLIPAAIVGATIALAPKAAEFMEGLLTGLGLNWDETVEPWLKALPDMAVTAIGDVIDTLEQKGKDLLQGLKNGADEIFAEIWAWVVERPDVIFTGIGDVTETLKSKGVDLLQGLWTGAKEKFTEITKWLSRMKATDGPIAVWVGGLGDTLLQAGRDLMGGLASGITNAWSVVSDALTGIWNQIPSWFKKLSGAGSPAKKAMPLGQWITWGIAEGVLQGMPRLEGALGRVAGVALSPLGGGSFGYAGMSSVSGGGWSGGGTTVNGGIHITVDGSKDPEATADAVFAKLNRELTLKEGL